MNIMTNKESRMDSKQKMENDPVSNPSHYTDRNIEVIDYIEDCGLLRGFALGNAIKYISRAGVKGGREKEQEDLKKATWYLNRWIGFLEKGDI